MVSRSKGDLESAKLIVEIVMMDDEDHQAGLADHIILDHLE